VVLSKVTNLTLMRCPLLGVLKNEIPFIEIKKAGNNPAFSSGVSI
jgi:hypothetical protein